MVKSRVAKISKISKISRQNKKSKAPRASKSIFIEPLMTLMTLIKHPPAQYVLDKDLFKKTQKTPPKEIKRAEDIMKLYYNQNGKDGKN